MSNYITKRDGVTREPFKSSKLAAAISKAANAAGQKFAVDVLCDLVTRIEEALPKNPNVETVQDTVEATLMTDGHFDVAKAYILYRNKRAEARSARTEKSPDPLAISDYIHASKYARYLPELKRREVYAETVARVEAMHVERFPHMEFDIRSAFDLVREKRVLPSMRSMQFAGEAIFKNNNRIYNCLSRDTDFITSEGVRSFADFADGDEITVLTHTGAWKRAVVRSFGQQQLFNVVLKRGSGTRTIRATANHQWLLNDGTRTTTLKVGDRLQPPPVNFGTWSYFDASPEERLYWAMGYVFGDGTCLRDKNGKPAYSMVRLCGDDSDFESRFVELGFKISRPPSCNGDAMAYTGKYVKELPSLAVDGIANVTAFVRGYLDADGNRNPNAYKPQADGGVHQSPFEGIQASSEGAIEFIQRVFPAVGVYVTREYDKTGEQTNYGTRPTTKSFGLNSGFGMLRPKLYVVQSITPSTVEGVWCLEVEDDHSFVLPSGIVTGNCSASPVDRLDVFGEALFLLLSGCGVGYSVQYRHVRRLPPLSTVNEKDVYHHVIDDTIEGWADALDRLIDSFFNGYNVEFAYHLIRPAGSPLKTSGGRAPGHLRLKEALERIRGVLKGAQGRKLRPIECHRIMCHAADAVLSGGIRRSAMICLFSLEDEQMLSAKTGNWYERDPWFANANNSAVLKRDEVQEDQFRAVFGQTKQWGEPGFHFVNDWDHLTNPCAEVCLYPFLNGQSGWAFCNLCEINAAKLTSLEDFVRAARSATLIGTLQAAYTDMPYLGWRSEEIAKRDALLGIGMTGMFDSPAVACDSTNQQIVSKLVKEWNAQFAAAIGINPAARTTLIKPSGTTSLELGCVASGHHPHHARRYIRRVTADELEHVFQAFKAVNPHMCVRKPDGKYVIEFPVEAPPGAIVKADLGAIQFLEMVKSTQQNWVIPGSRTLDMVHNVSNTVTVKPEEWDDVADYLWKNRDYFTGVSLLSSSGDKDYAFAPMEEVKTEADELRWNAILESYKPVDYTTIVEQDDVTDLTGEAACAGGVCEVL